MIRYLSLDWIDALSTAVANDNELSAAAAGRTIGVTQVVTDAPEGTVIYHLQVKAGDASFGAGPADPENVKFEQSWDTAVAVATGQLNVQDAFIRGHIRLYGDQVLLMESQPIFEALDRVFKQVRTVTIYTAAG